MRPGAPCRRPGTAPAIRLASVSPGSNSDVLMATLSPITCVTAIASPTARPSPRIIAAAIPARAYGKMTPRTISHRVAPSASAPSLSSLRHAEEELTADARDDRDDHDREDQDRGEHARADRRRGAEDREKAERPCSAGPSVLTMNGPRTRIPQSPRTTLGTAASISTRGRPPIRSSRARARSGRARSRSRSASPGSAPRRRDHGAEDERPGTEQLFVLVPGLRVRKSGRTCPSPARHRRAPRA